MKYVDSLISWQEWTATLAKFIMHWNLDRIQKKFWWLYIYDTNHRFRQTLPVFMPFYALYQLGLEIHYELSYECVDSLIFWQEWTATLTHTKAKFIMHWNLDRAQKKIWWLYMILIIYLDKLLLFYMSFYALYQLGLEIHYLVTCKSGMPNTTWQLWGLQ